MVEVEIGGLPGSNETCSKDPYPDPSKLLIPRKVIRPHLELRSQPTLLLSILYRLFIYVICLCRAN